MIHIIHIHSVMDTIKITEGNNAIVQKRKVHKLGNDSTLFYKEFF
jgi:hypothetical protein